MRQWLKSRREETGLSARQVAAGLGISESYYSLIEKGERQKNLDFCLAVKLSHLLSIPLGKLAEYEGTREEEPQ